MKILFINIPLRPYLPHYLFPIGMGYILSATQNAGIAFDLLDLDILRWEEEQTRQYLENGKYDVICMGSLVSGYKYIKRLCKLCREVSPLCTIVVGNSVSTSIPEILMKNTEADIGVMREGDETIVEILQAIEQKKPLTGIKGIFYKNESNLIMTAPREPLNVHNLPYINWDLFDVEKYIESGKDFVNIEIGKPIRNIAISSARGCIANCHFCYNNMKGLPFRYRKPEAIVGEIRAAKDKYNISYVQLWDEITFFSVKQAEALADEFIKANLDVNWMARCRANLFEKDEDLDIIKKMKDAGCIKTQFSLESGDENILRDMNKKIKVSQFRRQVELFKKAGVEPITSLVFGMPNETKATIEKTIDICIECGIYPSGGFLLPQPGSKMYEYALQNGYIKNEEEYILNMGDRQDLAINLTKMSDEEFVFTVENAMKKCNIALGVGKGVGKGVGNKNVLKSYEGKK